MRTSEAKRKQPSKSGTKVASRSTPARSVAKEAPRQHKEAPRVQAEAPRAATPDGNGTVPMPDLTSFGVAASDAQAHVGQCEPCGRAHRHVVKNPKDVMALESFGRHIASCLGGKQAASHA